jgi:hypothetical protein
MLLPRNVNQDIEKGNLVRLCSPIHRVALAPTAKLDD